ncbi:alternate-type signal peptide domain-containing protein [Nocardioides salarius]|uniref:alternate-type signal peptide domain-containing protein n=1 Tax=Nocardioides salarius TaxID=374513 RepID=UPI0030F7E710
MRASLKAALAGVAGAGLLLGGAGSLAFWDDTEDLTGGTITPGVLDLGAPSCDPWQLDTAGGDFDLDTDTIVPGDTLVQVCELTLDVTGGHLKAEIEADAPSFGGTNDLDSALQAAAVYELDTDAVDDDTGETVIDPEAGPVEFTVANDGQTLRVEMTLTFPFGSSVSNVTNNGPDAANGAEDATLEDTTITVTQSNVSHGS